MTGQPVPSSSSSLLPTILRRNLTVQSSHHLAQESWFLEAIDDAPDFLYACGTSPLHPRLLIENTSILAGHMPARGYSSEFGPVYEAIRRRHPLVPIFIFGTLIDQSMSSSPWLTMAQVAIRTCGIACSMTSGPLREPLQEYRALSHAGRVVPGRYMETVAFTS